MSPSRYKRVPRAVRDKGIGRGPSGEVASGRRSHSRSGRLPDWGRQPCFWPGKQGRGLGGRAS